MCTGWVKRCTHCAKRIRNSAPPPRIINAIPTQGFLDHVQADCISFLDRRTNPTGYLRVILHLKCMASKWSELVLLVNKAGPTLRDAFWSIFTRIGPPRILQTDNGTEFINPEMQQLITDCGIEDYRHGRPYRPQTQGVVERSNRVLRVMLEGACNDITYQDWLFADVLKLVQYWINTQSHRSLRMSSYQYVFGRPPPLIKARPSLIQEQLEEEEYNTDEEAEMGQKTITEDTIVPIIPDTIESLEPASSQHLTPQEDAAATIVNHNQRRAAANATHAIYQEQWTARVNEGSSDNTYRVGDVVLFQVMTRGHQSLSRQLERQRGLVIRALPYSKYAIHTIHGTLKECIHGNDLAQITPTAIIPPQLKLTQVQIADLAKIHKEQGKDQLLTTRKYLEKILEMPMEATGAHVIIPTPKEGDSDFNPKIIVTRKRKMNRQEE